MHSFPAYFKCDPALDWGFCPLLSNLLVDDDAVPADPPLLQKSGASVAPIVLLQVVLVDGCKDIYGMIGRIYPHLSLLDSNVPLWSAPVASPAMKSLELIMFQKMRIATRYGRANWILIRGVSR